MLQFVWKSHALRTSTKVRIFTTNVKSVLLYGSETWRKQQPQTARSFINKCLTNIIGIRWAVEISNTNLWNRTNQQSIELNNTCRIESDQGSGNE